MSDFKNVCKKVNSIMTNTGLEFWPAFRLLSIKENFKVGYDDDYIDLIEEEYVDEDLNITFKGLTAVKEVNKALVTAERNITFSVTTKSYQALKDIMSLFIPDGLPSDRLEYLCTKYKVDLEVAIMLELFVNMFPTSNKSANIAWDTAMNYSWDNVTLRKLTDGCVAKLLKIFNKKDVGIFFLGTLLFLQGSYNSSNKKYFIKSVINYLNEYEVWYNEALETIKTLDLGTDLVRKEVEHSNTYVL